jgi:hypothetical protein
MFASSQVVNKFHRAYGQSIDAHTAVSLHAAWIDESMVQLSLPSSAFILHVQVPVDYHIDQFYVCFMCFIVAVQVQRKGAYCVLGTDIALCQGAFVFVRTACFCQGTDPSYMLFNSGCVLSHLIEYPFHESWLI